MRTTWTMLTIIALTVSCSNFDNKEYWTEENNAIADLIPKMVEADYMLKHNDFGTTKPTLYIIAELVNKLELHEYDSVTEKDLKRLIPLTKSKIPARNIPTDLIKQFHQFDIKLLTITEYENEHRSMLTYNFNKGGLLGYLGISRIVFTDDYKLGYVSFDFYCGEGCAWNSVIEIKKINGHWTENRFICGGIA